MKQAGIRFVLSLLLINFIHSNPFVDRNTISKIVENRSKSVVNVSAKFRRDTNEYKRIPGMFGYFFHPPIRPRTKAGEGSGVITSRDGLILTNSHVVNEADEIVVTLADGRKFNAILDNQNPVVDLALLRIEDPSFDGNLSPEYVAALGNSDELKVGEWVIAIGSPFSLEGTVTAGIVSAKGRNLGQSKSLNYGNLIQTDASINPGNSGGPLLNLDGKVVGINTAINPNGQGLGFSIPINLARRMISDVEQFGEIQQSWLGVAVQDVTQNIAAYLGLDIPKGALIQKVIDGTPAQEGGLIAGDVILKVNSLEIKDKDQLIYRIQEIPVGETINLQVSRRGNLIALKAKLAQKKDYNKLSQVPNKSGVTTASINREDRKRLGLHSETKGVLVKSVRPSSFADKVGFEKDDVILQINQVSIKSGSKVKSLITEYLSDQSSSFLAMIIREGKIKYLEGDKEGS